MSLYDVPVSMNKSAKAATPAKLPSGAWGARSKHACCVGDTLNITTRSGKNWTAKVVTVLDGGLFETRSDGPAKSSRNVPTRAPRRAPSARRGCGYPGCNGRNYCDECTDT